MIVAYYLIHFTPEQAKGSSEEKHGYDRLKSAPQILTLDSVPRVLDIINQ